MRSDQSQSGDQPNNTRQTFRALYRKRMMARMVDWAHKHLLLISVVFVQATAGAQGGVRVSQDTTMLRSHLAQEQHQQQKQPQKQPSKQKQQHEPGSRVSLVVRDSSVTYVIRTIIEQAKMRLVYDADDPTFARRINVNVVNLPVLSALNVALAGTGLVATVMPDGETIAVRSTPKESSEKHRERSVGTVTGRVIDSATGKGIAGATVTVVGIALSVVTNTDGSFVLTNVPAGECSLRVKILGYASTTRTVQVEENRTTSLQIVLKQTANMLSGVVTTVAGTQQKLEVGNSIVSLNVDSIMQTAPITSVTDLLEARVPGMTVQRTSGTPGDPARIRLRGASSIYANNDPIIVVDGIRVYSRTSDERNLNGDPSVRTYTTPSPLDQIDPNTIATIEVLKGPSASAMYGSDAANGVIIITTKRGQAGATRINITGDFGKTSLPRKWPTAWHKFVTPTMGGTSTLCYGYCGDSRVDSLVSFQALNSSRFTALGTGYNTGLSATVSGGAQSTRYSVTLSTGNELGILKLPDVDAERFLKYQGSPAPSWMRRPDRLERRSMSGRMDVDINPKVNFGLATMLANQVQHRTSMSSSGNTAIAALQDKYIDISQLSEEPLLGNPYERVTSNNLSVTNSLSFNARPVTWFPVNGTMGLQTLIQSNETKLPQGLLPGVDSVGLWSGSKKTSTNLTGMASTSIPVQQRLSLAFGVNFTKESLDDQAGNFKGLTAGIETPAEGTTSQFRRDTREQQTFGWFFEPRLNIQSRFFVMPGFRLDNNSLSGKNAKFNGLPKMNLSWLMSDEAFFPWKHAIRMFRVRTAFGEAGVQPNVQDGLRLYTRVVNGNGQVNPDYGNMLGLRTLGNSRLRPERGSEFEGGIDAELWNGRLSFDLTQFRKIRKDAIILVPYAPSADGGGSRLLNIGDFRNSGTELSMQAQLLEQRGIGIHLAVTYSRQRSLVMRLRPDADSVSRVPSPYDPPSLYRVGYPLLSYWARPIVGFADLNGDKMLSPDEISLGFDPVFLGSQDPAYQLSAQPSATLWNGRLRVHSVWQYVKGQFQIQGTSGTNRVRYYLNDPAIGLWAFAADAATQAGSSYGIAQNSDVLRLQSVSVSLEAGQRVASLLRAKTLNIALQGGNVGLWTDYRGVDPNVNGFMSGDAIGDRGNLPEPRLWTLRLSLGF